MASKPLIKLDDKVRVSINQLLADFQSVRAEAVKQDQAMVPEMAQAIERCDDCIARLITFKEINYPGKK